MNSGDKYMYKIRYVHRQKVFERRKKGQKIIFSEEEKNWNSSIPTLSERKRFSETAQYSVK